MNHDFPHFRGSRAKWTTTLALHYWFNNCIWLAFSDECSKKKLSECTLVFSWENKFASATMKSSISQPQIKTKSSLKSNSSRSLLTMSHDVTKLGLISTDELKEFLECPVCLRVPRSTPVYQCDRGHIVCNECHPKLSLCPMCRCPMGHTRSLISEKVMNRYSSNFVSGNMHWFSFLVPCQASLRLQVLGQRLHRRRDKKYASYPWIWMSVSSSSMCGPCKKPTKDLFSRNQLLGLFFPFYLGLPTNNSFCETSWTHAERPREGRLCQCGWTPLRVALVRLSGQNISFEP